MRTGAALSFAQAEPAAAANMAAMRDHRTRKRIMTSFKRPSVGDWLHAAPTMYLLSRYRRVLRLFLLATGCCLLATASAARAAAAGSRVSMETIPGSLVKFEMVRVPPGTLVTADPAPPAARRTVKINGFWLGKTEVTWD